MVEDWMKCCRYCRFFEDGYCSKNVMEIELETNIDQLFEDGYLSAAIAEGFNEKEFHSISKNRKKDFDRELDDVINNWTESIDEQISIMLRNNLLHISRFKPMDSNSFCCNQWD